MSNKICPLCGRANGCTGDRSCWCMTVKVPKALREQVPPEKKGSCICRPCVEEYLIKHPEEHTSSEPKGGSHVHRTIEKNH